MPTDVSLSELQEHGDSSPVPTISGRVTKDSEIPLLEVLIVLAKRMHVIFWVTAVSQSRDLRFAHPTRTLHRESHCSGSAAELFIIHPGKGGANDD